MGFPPTQCILQIDECVALIDRGIWWVGGVEKNFPGDLAPGFQPPQHIPIPSAPLCRRSPKLKTSLNSLTQGNFCPNPGGDGGALAIALFGA